MVRHRFTQWGPLPAGNHRRRVCVLLFLGLIAATGEGGLLDWIGPVAPHYSDRLRRGVELFFGAESPVDAPRRLPNVRQDPALSHSLLLDTNIAGRRMTCGLPQWERAGNPMREAQLAERDRVARNHMLKSRMTWSTDICFTWLWQERWELELCPQRAVILRAPQKEKVVLGRYHSADVLADGRVIEHYSDITTLRSVNVTWACSLARQPGMTNTTANGPPESFSHMEVVMIAGQYCNWQAHRAPTVAARSTYPRGQSPQKKPQPEDPQSLVPLMAPLENWCTNFTYPGSYWTFEFCYPDSLLQFHLDKRKGHTMILVGKLDAWSKDQRPDVGSPSVLLPQMRSVILEKPGLLAKTTWLSLPLDFVPLPVHVPTTDSADNTSEFADDSDLGRRRERLAVWGVKLELGNGAVCQATGKPRSAKIIFFCPKSLGTIWHDNKHYGKVSGIREYATCQYEVYIASPITCCHPDLLPPLPLQEERTVFCVEQRTEELPLFPRPYSFSRLPDDISAGMRDRLTVQEAEGASMTASLVGGDSWRSALMDEELGIRGPCMADYQVPSKWILLALGLPCDETPPGGTAAGFAKGSIPEDEFAPFGFDNTPRKLHLMDQGWVPRPGDIVTVKREAMSGIVLAVDSSGISVPFEDYTLKRVEKEGPWAKQLELPHVLLLHLREGGYPSSVVPAAAEIARRLQEDLYYIPVSLLQPFPLPATSLSPESGSPLRSETLLRSLLEDARTILPLRMNGVMFEFAFPSPDSPPTRHLKFLPKEEASSLIGEAGNMVYVGSLYEENEPEAIM